MTHYDTLGVKRGASAAEVKSAYRKLVLAHHPDKSTDPRSGPLFLAGTAAYEVLTNPEAKLRYDESLDEAERRRTRVSAPPAQPSGFRIVDPEGRPNRPEPPKPRITLSDDLKRLTNLLNRGNHTEADKLARQILEQYPSHAVPYAVLGDISRLRGNLNDAARMYAYAAQFDGTNLEYQRRYEEILSNSKVVETSGRRTSLTFEDRNVLAPMAGTLVLVGCALFTALSQESAVFHQVTQISTWTPGLVIALFLSGISVGASLAMGNLLDRFQSSSVSSMGRLTSSAVIGFVALFSFWLSVALYALLGFIQHSFPFSSIRIVGGSAFALLLMVVAAACSSHIDPLQVFFWGGNLIHIGALIGWMLADSFR